MSPSRPILLLLSFCLVVPRLQAAAPHPSVLAVKYNGEFVPVVRVKGTNPYVLVDGKEKMIRSEPVYTLQDGTGFSENFVTVPSGSLGGKMHHQLIGANTYDASVLHQGEIDLNISMTAHVTLKGGFVAVIMISSAGPSDIIVQELPELPAGQRVKVKLSVHALPHDLDPTFFAQVFDGVGREVLTNEIGYAWSYYAARDRARLAVAVKEYVAKNQDVDHELVPTFTPKPVFGPGAVLPQGEVTVQLSVSDEGTVTNVDAGLIADDRARQSVIDALGGWLFLPKLKAGQPVYTYLNVPLQF